MLIPNNFKIYNLVSSEQRFRRCLEHKTIEQGWPNPVAYLGFPAPGGKRSFGAPPTQPVHGIIDAKNELGIKGCRKLTRALQSPAYICF